ncbi:MFS family permease [Allocatelliglobosispora scoriae]|uniref:MFS family permease n=1 Tax=Allocatelliglobosispora scoriae TaxID=643052 RepID=A0A841BIX6_9ACTN|nr:MFS transporter [Allocatelliglobosispora scoriae]MBB5867146.1 MFS family permease [Allocatelliglobosispora scoriae]
MDDQEAAAPPLQWRDNRDFNLFLLVQTFSTAGNTFTMVAIPLLVLHATGSVVQMGLVTGAGAVANILAGIFAGVIVDRFDRRRLLIVCDVARGVIYASIPVAWLFATPIWLLYVVVPLGGALAMLFQVTYVAILPRLVDAEQLTQANGRLSASYATAGIAGPIIAGILSARYGPATAIGVDAATFLAAAVGIFFVRFRSPAPTEAPAEAVPFWRNLLVGARFLWRHPVLRSLTALLTLLIFIHLGLIDLIIYYLKTDLGQPDSTIGYVLAVTGLGTIAGSLLVARVRRRFGFGLTWVAATMLCGAGIAGLGFAASVPAVALLSVVTFGFSTIAGICSMTLRQQVTPNALLGRVTAAYWTIHSTLGPVGAAVLTAAAAGFGVNTVLVVAGIAYMLIAAAGMLTPIRQRRPELLPVTG